MKNLTITLVSIALISFLTLYSSNIGLLNLSVNFPSSSSVLSKKKKTELKKNITIKNTELFIEKEKEELKEKIKIKNIELFIDSGDLEVIIK